MQFWKYERGEWKTEMLGTVELSQRQHHLFFIWDQLGMDAFAVVVSVNATEFLDVAPGLLMCAGVWVRCSLPMTKSFIGK